MSTRVALGTNSAAAATTVTVAISAAINAGDFILVLCQFSNLNAPSISDGLNTYTRRVTEAFNGSVAIFDSVNAGARPINTNVTITNGTVNDMAMVILKWTGSLANVNFDKTAGAGGTSTSPASGNTATTAQAVQIWCGALANNSGITLSSGGAGWTVGQSASVAGSSEVTELFQETAATGQANANGTWNASASWNALVATYNEAAVAAVGGRIPNVPTIPTIPTVGTPI